MVSNLEINEVINNSIKYLFMFLVLIFPFSISVRNLILGLILLFYIIHLIFEREINIPETIFNKEILAFFIISVLSLFKANNITMGLDGLISPVIRSIFFFYIGYKYITVKNTSIYTNILFYGSIAFIVIGKIADYKLTEDFLQGNGAGTWAGFFIFLCLSFIFDKNINIFQKVIFIVSSITGIIILFNANKKLCVFAKK